MVGGIVFNEDFYLLRVNTVLFRYALFSITDKSSSFLGPLLVGLIADATGNIRYAFFFLTGMIWLAVPLLMSVNVERGRKDALDYGVSKGRGVRERESDHA